MRRSLFVFVLAVLALLAAMLPSGAVVRSDSRDSASLLRSSALVRLVGAPVSVAAKTKPAQGKKINFNSTSVKSYRAQLAARRSEFKKWLRANAPKARVSGEFDVALNALSVALNGTPLAKLRESSLVAEAQYEGLYRMAAHDDPDLELVNGLEGWAAAGATGDKGADVKIAVIDAGIAAQHPCFDGSYPDADIADPGWTQYVNDKVVVAKVFHNKAKRLGLTPEPTIEGHGTHVAGTAACEEHTDAAIDGVQIPYDPSGVAPKAYLGNYNVFPGEVAEARSEDILEAMEEAAEDGMDVMNMSLGDILPKGRQDLLTMAADNLDRAGIVMAISAGNEGPGHDTIGTPGSAARALTAGASAVDHQFLQHVSVGTADYDAVRGDFAQPTVNVTAPLEVVEGAGVHNLSEACDPLAPGSLTGKIGLVARGTCDFTVKVRNAANAGATGLIVGNRNPGESPFVMAHNGLEDKPNIPAFMISFEDAADARTRDGQSTTLFHQGQYKRLADTANRMADFSSQGPTNVSFLVKPDLVAPGQNVLSAYPGSDCGTTGCWSFLGGTSMASPHLAGAAAVVKASHPTWGSAHIRSAVTNTADRNALKTTDGKDLTDVLVEGAGLLQLDDAVNAVVALDPVSVSFGAIPSGSGQTRSTTLRLTNLTSTATTFNLAAGAPFTLSASSLALAGGETKSVRVTYRAPKGTAGDISNYLTVSAGTGEVAHAVLYALQR